MAKTAQQKKPITPLVKARAAVLKWAMSNSIEARHLTELYRILEKLSRDEVNLSIRTFKAMFKPRKAS